jgi:hypothetical protein
MIVGIMGIKLTLLNYEHKNHILTIKIIYLWRLIKKEQYNGTVGW